MAKVNDRTARKLQIAMMNAIYKQIVTDPLGVSASTLAVAERLLARYNMGLETFVAEDLTEEEIQMIKEFEDLKLELDSDLFAIADEEPMGNID